MLCQSLSWLINARHGNSSIFMSVDTTTKFDSVLPAIRSARFLAAVRRSWVGLVNKLARSEENTVDLDRRSETRDENDILLRRQKQSVLIIENEGCNSKKQTTPHCHTALLRFATEKNLNCRCRSPPAAVIIRSCRRHRHPKSKCRPSSSQFRMRHRKIKSSWLCRILPSIIS